MTDHPRRKAASLGGLALDSFRGEAEGGFMGSDNYDGPVYVTFSKIIKATELLARWPGCPENDLAQQCRNNILKCYLYNRTLKKPTGELVNYCSPCLGPYDSSMGEEYCWEWDGIVFNVEDVIEFEIAHPEYLWELVSLESKPEAHEKSDARKSQNNYLTAEDLCQRWSVSPAQLVEIINGDSELPVYWRSSNVPF